tara:strand:+ start:10888 stop:13437 length:2550 start_codon:yes stop_codon:yes gene_type:complete
MARIPTPRNQGAKAYQSVNMSDGQTRFMNVQQVDVDAGTREQRDIWVKALDGVAAGASKWQEGNDKRELVALEGKITKLQSYLLEDPDFGGVGTLKGDDALKRINGGWSREMDSKDPSGAVVATKYAIARKEFEDAGFVYDDSKSLADNYQENIKRLKELHTTKMGGVGTASADDYINKTTNAFVNNVNKFQDVAYKAKNELLFTGKLTDYTEVGSLQFNNETALGATLSNVKSLVLDSDIGIAAQKGITDPAIKDQLVQENQALVVEGAIKQAMAVGDTAAAQKLLDAYRSSANPTGKAVLQGEKLTTLTELVRKNGDIAGGQNFVNELLDQVKPNSTDKQYITSVAGGQLQLYDIAGLYEEVRKKYAGKNPEMLKAANSYIAGLAKINQERVVVDEKEAIREFNKLISENKTPPPELLARLPANYNVSSRIASASGNVETTTDMSIHAQNNGSPTTLTTANGKAYDQVLLQMLESDSGAAYVIANYSGSDENDRDLRSLLSADAYETVSAKIAQKRAKIEKDALEKSGIQFPKIEKILKDELNISSQALRVKIHNSPVLRAELDAFYVRYAKKNGVAPDSQTIKKFIAPYVVRLVTGTNLINQPNEFGYFSGRTDSEIATSIDIQRVDVGKTRSKNILAMVLGTTPDNLEKAIEIVKSRAGDDDSVRVVNLGNLNQALLEIGNRNAEDRLINPLALMSEDTYNLAVGFGNTDRGLLTFVEQSGIKAYLPGPNGTGTAAQVKGALFLLERLSQADAGSNLKLPPITEDIINGIPDGNKQASVAFKEYMKKVNAVFSAPGNRASIANMLGTLATGKTLFSNVDVKYLRDVKYNSGYAAELQLPAADGDN